jgi:teichuronic acid biosynthesis glycosyltransferase TuaC
VTPRLLFFSNLFPTESEPYRGLDNATLLHALRPHFDIRVLSPRPALPWNSRIHSQRICDAPLKPRWAQATYLPKIGGSINHLLMAKSVRPAFDLILRDFKTDIILSSWIFPDSCAALHLANGRFPVVAIAQGTDIHQYLNMAARREVILKSLPRTHAVITRSRELSHLLAAAGFPSAKLHTINNGVSHDIFQPRDKALTRQQSNLPATARIILFVGNFYEIKNPLLLIRAVAQLESALLIMAGGGPLAQDARALAEKLGITSRVLFPGRQPPSEIARLMNAADLLTIPSNNEGVPNVILEAFASGLPVVASNVGGIPEVLDNASLGRTFPAGDLDALVAALRDQLAAPRDTAAIREHAARFTWDASADAYREILMAALR